MRLLGRDPRKAGRNQDVDLVAALDATTPVTTKITATKYLDPTWKALDCYASQIHLPALIRRFRRVLGRSLQGTAAFSRVYPEWHAGDKIERDLFEHVTYAVQPDQSGT